MTLVRLWGAVCLWLVILSGAALGQGNDLEITITLIPSGAEREADLTSRIELPRAAATTAVARSAAGLAVANESREEAAARGEDGRARAAVARENGLAIADDGNVRVDVLADLRRIDIDVNHFGMRSKPADVARHSVVEARAHRDK